MPLLQIMTLIAVLLTCALATLLLWQVSRQARFSTDLLAKVGPLEQGLRDLPTAFREESRLLREEASAVIAGQQSSLETRIGSFTQAQGDQLVAMRQEASDGRAKLEEALKSTSETFSHTQTTRLGAATSMTARHSSTVP